MGGRNRERRAMTVDTRTEEYRRLKQATHAQAAERGVPPNARSQDVVCGPNATGRVLQREPAHTTANTVRSKQPQAPPPLPTPLPPPSILILYLINLGACIYMRKKEARTRLYPSPCEC